MDCSCFGCYPDDHDGKHLLVIFNVPGFNLIGILLQLLDGGKFIPGTCLSGERDRGIVPSAEEQLFYCNFFVKEDKAGHGSNILSYTPCHSWTGICHNMYMWPDNPCTGITTDYQTAVILILYSRVFYIVFYIELNAKTP